MGHESLSYSIGEGRDQIEFFSSYDSSNLTGADRISVNPLRFGKSGIHAIVKHHIESAQGIIYYIVVDDRRMLKLDTFQFIKAKDATPRGRNEFMEAVVSIISHSNMWSIEKPSPPTSTNVIVTF